MSLLPDLPRIQNAVELLDGPASLSELEANFRDISRLNRYFGGSWVTRSHLVRLLGERLSGSVTVLDVGSGGGGNPLRPGGGAPPSAGSPGTGTVISWTWRGGGPQRIPRSSSSRPTGSACPCAAPGWTRRSRRSPSTTWSPTPPRASWLRWGEARGAPWPGSAG